MRGEQIYQQLLISEDQTPDSSPDKKKKGRSSELIDQRNDLLIHRMAWYQLFKSELRYEVVLDKLKMEFHLAEYTLGDLLLENAGAISKLKRSQPSRKYFREKFDWIVW